MGLIICCFDILIMIIFIKANTENGIRLNTFVGCILNMAGVRNETYLSCGILNQD